LPTPQLFAVFVSRQGMVPAVRAFVDFLVEKLDEENHTMMECPTREQVRAAQLANTEAASALVAPVR
jgi:hypothetical protein